jgi:hypothetical protein
VHLTEPSRVNVYSFVCLLAAIPIGRAYFNQHSMVDLEHVVLERVITLCPPGRKVEVQFQDEEGFAQAQWAAQGHLIVEEFVKWVTIKEWLIRPEIWRSWGRDRKTVSRTSSDLCCLTHNRTSRWLIGGEQPLLAPH